MRHQPRPADVDAVRRAVLDYVEATYEVAPERASRSLHPDLAKLGFVLDGGSYTPYRTTFEEAVEAAATFNVDGRIPADAPKTVTVFEVLDQTASAKLEAWWGVDHLHLAKQDGAWRIVQVLWQTPPPA